MKYKTGILCAGDQEAAPFLSMLKEASVSQKAMLKFYHGTLEGTEAVALFSGVCKTNAAIAAQLLIDYCGCNAIINAGTAGGIDRNIHLFDTVISTETAYWDVADGILTEFHPWLETIYFKADPELLEAAGRAVFSNRLQNVFFGRMLTGEAFIEDEHRDEIIEKYNPLCVDMETASVAHVCHVNQIPFLSVRTITDTAEHLGEFEKNCDRASHISAGVVKALLKELP